MIRKSFLPFAPALLVFVPFAFAPASARQQGAAPNCAAPGRPYGKYPFSVKGGRIQLQGNQVRGRANALGYISESISGGRYTSRWIRREGAR